MQADQPTEIPLIELERWALGSMDPERAAALERQAQQDADLALRMARVRREIEAAAHDLPPLDLPAEGAQRAWWRRPWLLPVSAGLATAAVLLVVQPWDPAPPAGEVFRGSFDLELLQVRLGLASPQGALVHGRDGDRLQYTLVPTRAGTLHVFDLQDDGRVQQIGAPRAVVAGEAATGALLLDDYRGSERLFFLLAEEPLVPGQVQQAVDRVHALPLAEVDRLPGLGQGTLQRSVLVLKEDVP